MPPWIFIQDTDKVEGGLLIFFCLVYFFRCPFPYSFSADALASGFNN